MYLIVTSLVCPVGLSSSSACAAMRAGIAGFMELPYLDNERRPVIGACVPGVDLTLKRGPRIVRLLAMAMDDLLAKCPGLKTERIPLIVGLAELGRPGGGAGLTEAIIPAVQKELKIRFHPQLSRAQACGHVAGFTGLHVARQLLQDPDVPACVVSGVDSCINAATLHWLERNGRLKTDDNSNGVIPGEAAGAVLVQKAPPRSSASVLVTGLGFAVEKVHVMSEEPFLGFGLAEATRFALREAAQQLNQMDFRLSDVTGESYGFKEQSLTLSRVLRQGPSELPLWHSADAIGDVGAAAGICHLTRAFDAFAKGYAPGERAIGFSSNVSGDRAAATLQWHDTSTIAGSIVNQPQRPRS
jgi:3-oxoacyl-[acyl-carrier-protein] synthase-1